MKTLASSNLLMRHDNSLEPRVQDSQVELQRSLQGRCSPHCMTYWAGKFHPASHEKAEERRQKAMIGCEIRPQSRFLEHVKAPVQ